MKDLPPIALQSFCLHFHSFFSPCIPRILLRRTFPPTLLWLPSKQEHLPLQEAALDSGFLGAGAVREHAFYSSSGVEREREEDSLSGCVLI